MSIETKIIKTNITKLDFNLELETKEKIELSVETTANLSKPKNSDDKTAMFYISVNVRIPNSNEIEINMTARLIFEFDTIPDDYDEIGKNVCLPMAQDLMFTKIDEILDFMGYPKFNLKGH